MPCLYQLLYKHSFFFRYFRSWYISTILTVKVNTHRKAILDDRKVKVKKILSILKTYIQAASILKGTCSECDPIPSPSCSAQRSSCNSSCPFSTFPSSGDQTGHSTEKRTGSASQTGLLSGCGEARLSRLGCGKWSQVELFSMLNSNPPY